jgi:hypothetical protein
MVGSVQRCADTWISPIACAYTQPSDTVAVRQPIAVCSDGKNIDRQARGLAAIRHASRW